MGHPSGTWAIPAAWPRQTPQWELSTAAATSQQPLSEGQAARLCFHGNPDTTPLRRLCPCKAGSPNPLPPPPAGHVSSPSTQPQALRPPRGPPPTQLPLGLRGVFTPGAWWGPSPVPEGASLGLPGQPGKPRPATPSSTVQPRLPLHKSQPASGTALPTPGPARLAVHLRSATAWSADSEYGALPWPGVWRRCPCSTPGGPLPPPPPKTPRELCPFQRCGQDRHQALCSWCLETPLRSCSPRGGVSASTPPRTRSPPPHKAARESQQKIDSRPRPWLALPSGLAQLAQRMPAPPQGSSGGSSPHC